MGHRCWWMVGTAIPILFSCSWRFSRWNVASQRQPKHSHCASTFTPALEVCCCSLDHLDLKARLPQMSTKMVMHPKSIQKSPTLGYGYGSIPINTICSGMNIHLPAILMFTRGTRFWHTAMLENYGSPIDLVAQFHPMVYHQLPQKSHLKSKSHGLPFPAAAARQRCPPPGLQ